MTISDVEVCQVSQEFENDTQGLVSDVTVVNCEPCQSTVLLTEVQYPVVSDLVPELPADTQLSQARLPENEKFLQAPLQWQCNRT